MKAIWRGCLVTCMLGWAYGYPTKEQMEKKMYVSKTKMSDLESSASGYVYKNIPAAKYAELIEESLEDFEEAAPGTTAKNQFVILPLVLEPDAEMLPAHYTGVKPPGVDHMELTFLEPAAYGTHNRGTLIEGSAEADAVPAKSSEFQEGGGKQFAVVKHLADAAKGENGFKKALIVEQGQKGELEKEKHKGQYAEAAGKRKAHSESEIHFNGHKDLSEGERGASFEVEGSHKKGRNSAGYHNIYHKDEYKKDADFYDSDHKGGNFKKHGRYGEKHVSAEGAYKKGGNSDSGFAQAEAAKEGEFEKGRANVEKLGHAAKQGYQGFFGNFEEFAKKGGAAEGKKYGFSNAA